MEITKKDEYDSKRADLMLAATFFSILILVLIMVVFRVDGNTGLGATLIILIGKFATMIGNAYNFEFGSSRSSKTKDDTINKALDATPPAAVK